MMQSTLSYAHPRAADLFSMCLYERYYKDLKILNLCKSFVQAPLHLVTATGSSMFWNKNSIVKRINEVEETAFVRPKVWHSKESEHSELNYTLNLSINLCHVVMSVLPSHWDAIFLLLWDVEWRSWLRHIHKFWQIVILPDHFLVKLSVKLYIKWSLNFVLCVTVWPFNVYWFNVALWCSKSL